MNTIKNKKLAISKDELFNLYVVKQLSTIEIATMFNCTPRTILNHLVNENIDRRSFSDATILQHKKQSAEKKLERAKKFSSTWYSKPKEIRDRINKSKATKEQNKEQQIRNIKIAKMHSSHSVVSKAEDEFFKKLQLYFNADDIVRQYICDKYPFNCDFYIKSKDLFIEYNGHYTHGYEPFDCKNPEHIQYLESHKTINMTTWITRDVIKLQTAINNNIDLVIVYPKNKVYYVHNGNITTMQINDLHKI